MLISRYVTFLSEFSKFGYYNYHNLNEQDGVTAMEQQAQTATAAYDIIIELGERIDELKAENDRLKQELLISTRLSGKVVKSRKFKDCVLKAKSRLVEARLREELKVGFYSS